MIKLIVLVAFLPLAALVTGILFLSSGFEAGRSMIASGAIGLVLLPLIVIVVNWLASRYGD